MRKMSIAIVLVLVSSHAIANDDLMTAARQVFKPIPSAIPAVKDNPVTVEKAELGKMLFFDPRLSASGIISCNTCHNLGTGGVDAGPTSVGHGWQRSPSGANRLQFGIQCRAILGRTRAGSQGTSQGTCSGERRNECDPGSRDKHVELDGGLCR